MTTGDHCIIHCIIELYSTRDTVQKLFYIRESRGKCPLVNLLHIFGTPTHKYITGGLPVGGMVSMSTFLAWMHVYFISFDRINTVFYQCVFYFNIICSSDFFAKSSILLCSHGAYCLDKVHKKVCTQRIFNISRLALSIIIFVTLFRVDFLNLLFGWKREGRGRGENYPSTLTFVWQQLQAWNFAQGIFNTIGFEWCSYIPCDNQTIMD